MFFVLFRALFIIAVILGVAYFLKKQLRKIALTEPRREKLEEAAINIQETLKEVEKIPGFDKKKLHQARTNIEELLKEGKQDKKKCC